MVSDRESISIQWQPPLDDGGCPVLDYRVERDQDGTGLGEWTVVNDLAPRNDTNIRSHRCTSFPTNAVLGSSYLFRVVAITK